MVGRVLRMPPLRSAEEQAELAERRARIAPGTPAGIDEAMIAAQVHAFYGRVRADAVLGPIFEAHVADWESHLARLCDFWSSVMLMTGRFKGTPMRTHAALPGLKASHFARWLAIWKQTAGEVCPPEAAAVFEARAEMIARGLMLGLAVSRGDAPGQPVKI